MEGRSEGNWEAKGLFYSEYLLLHKTSDSQQIKIENRVKGRACGAWKEGGMWCVERKGWDQHESAGDQLIDVARH